MLRDVVINLLHNLGGRAEVDRYLREYTEGGQRVAVIKVGGGLIADDLDELSSALAFLHHVGLRPVVVHGGGPQLTAELDAMVYIVEGGQLCYGSKRAWETCRDC